MSRGTAVKIGDLQRVLASARDAKTHAALRESVRAARCVAFVGAGMSARAGFTDWSGLLDKLRAEVLRGAQQRPFSDGSVLVKDMSWRAEEIRDLIRDDERYFKVLSKHFASPGKRDRAIDAFCSLNFRHVFTTNYDTSLEASLRRQLRHRKTVEPLNWILQGSPARALRSFGEGANNLVYLTYLHGRADAPESIVLSERDYRTLYVRSDESIRKLFAIFSMRQVAFFGFSLEDLDVLSIFRQVRAANDDVVHFAVLPDPTVDDRERVRARLISKFGIHPIFYLPGGPQHPNLLPVIVELGKSTAPRKRSRVVRTATTKMKWTETLDFKKGEGLVDPEDPQKGRFGGLARRNNRMLRATVSQSEDAANWFDLEIEVVSTNRTPLAGRVDLWVHDSFPRTHYYTQARNGRARFTFSVYGAFTVGAIAGGGRTPLELDLSKLRGAPQRFVTS